MKRMLQIGLFIACWLWAVQAKSQELPASHRGVTAHRGNSIQFPENTIPAFKSAIALKVEWAELDIYRTKDGKLVVSHDATTDRTGDRKMVIAEHTYQELKEVDVAYAFRQRKGLSTADCPKEQMPLLEEVLSLFARQRTTHLSIQPKVDAVTEAVALVKKMHMERQVGFNDGNLNLMSKVKELAPEVRVFWDVLSSDRPISADIETAKQKGFESLVLYYPNITQKKIRAVRAAGLEAGAWTVDEEPLMERFLKMGVQRIYTDDPGLLFRVKEKLENEMH